MPAPIVAPLDQKPMARERQADGKASLIIATAPRRKNSFTDADAHAAEEKLLVRGGEAAAHSRQGPERHSACNDQFFSLEAIEQNACRHTQAGKDKREGESDQKTHFSIGNMQILLDGADQQRQRLAIDKGKNIRAPKHSHQIPVGKRWSGSQRLSSRLRKARLLRKLQHCKRQPYCLCATVVGM
jgi:hypothetical protein